MKSGTLFLFSSFHMHKDVGDLIYIPGDLAHYATDQQLVWNTEIYEQKTRKETQTCDYLLMKVMLAPKTAK